MSVTSIEFTDVFQPLLLAIIITETQKCVNLLKYQFAVGPTKTGCLARSLRSLALKKNSSGWDRPRGGTDQDSGTNSVDFCDFDTI